MDWEADVSPFVICLHLSLPGLAEDHLCLSYFRGLTYQFLINYNNFSTFLGGSRKSKYGLVTG